MKTINVLLILGLLFCNSSMNTYSQEFGFFKITGYATEDGETTGGTGGSEITVSTGTALQNAINTKKDDTSPLIIYINGTITPGNSTGLTKIDVKEVENLSIIGVGTSGEFNGIGMKIYKANNIIIRNIKIHHVLTGEKDCIGIEGPADHIWIDHCELYNEFQGVNKDYYDGLLDAKKDCDYITYSWNYLHDSWKTSLVGSSESDTYNRHITMHHNYYENCNSRLPLFRASTGHFFNNYYKDIASTTINSRINACAKIENNYFENANNPWISAYSDILGGGDVSGNELVNSPFAYSDDNEEYELPACELIVPYEYNTVLDDATDVPSIVMTYAGVGKLDIGGSPVYKLTTSVSGTGTITREPDKALYDSGEVVTITAVPETNWTFNEWSGYVTGSELSKDITMTEDVSATAHFTSLTSIFSLENTESQMNIYYDSHENINIGIRTTESENIRLYVINISGYRTLMYSGHTSGQSELQIVMDKNQYTPGVYFVECISDLKREVRKVVVK